MIFHPSEVDLIDLSRHRPPNPPNDHRPSTLIHLLPLLLGPLPRSITYQYHPHGPATCSELELGIEDGWKERVEDGRTSGTGWMDEYRLGRKVWGRRFA
jgi:hypothetical protein